MAQIETHATTVKKVVTSHFFTRGMKDYLAGRGFDPEYDEWPYRKEGKFRNAQWSYERGRQYAAATGGAIPTKVGAGNKSVSYTALAKFAELYNAKHIL